MVATALESPARLVRGGFDKSTENLWVEQRLTWRGVSPHDATWKAVPDMLIDAHFEEVQRALGGILRCRRMDGRTECVFPGGPSALVFEKDAIQVDHDRVLVSMRILGGALARGSNSYGSLRLGVSRTIDGDACLISAWQEVDGYPSRLLRRSRLPGFRIAYRAIGRIYRAYHAVVTFRSLERVRQELEAAAVRH
jgi:hypothetical protein